MVNPIAGGLQEPVAPPTYTQDQAVENCASACTRAEITDLRQSRRLELMNGSKPCGPSGNARAPSRRRTRGAIRLAPFPSPRPSPLGPLGRGRIGPRAANDQTRL